jgi:hypothetical protein
MALGLKFPQTPDEKYKASVMFSATSSSGGGQVAGGPAGVGAASGAGPAILYLPEAISFSDGIVYDNANLNLAGLGAETFANKTTGKNITEIVNNLTQDLEQFSRGGSLGNADAFKNFVDNNGAVVGNLLLQTLAAGEVADGISSATGITANPHKRSLFRDVAIRNFTFTFLMSPSTAAEATAINNIVKFFRINAYPEKIGIGLAYKFPTTFDIKMFYDGKIMADAPKLLPCYLTSVSTVFNPRSSSFFKDGRFNETQLSLNFMEERPLDKKEIEKGF